MQIKNLPHPEDSILTGDVSVLDWFTTSGNLSVKMDGSVCIFFGKDPTNGRKFVATKSIFNKKKNKICYTQEDVFRLYDETTHAELIEILCACLKYLPDVNGIFAADFIGFGGSDEYTPNVITYKFPEVIRQILILAPHTEYQTESELKDSYMIGTAHLESTDQILFVQPKAYILHDPWNKSEGIVSFDDVEEVCNFARQMSSTVQFVSDKKAEEIKKQINTCIRSGVRVEPEDFDCDSNLIRFWSLVKSIKEDCLFLCRNDGPAAYLNEQQIDSEGYVLSNEFGTFKMVNREVFSYHNFNSDRFSCASS
jgi:hypothetical protein